MCEKCGIYKQYIGFVMQGHVKMNAFFYDYDDFDHTTSLVDWFETELSGQGSMTKDGHNQLVVRGNRQTDKTRSVQTRRHHLLSPFIFLLYS